MSELLPGADEIRRSAAPICTRSFVSSSRPPTETCGPVADPRSWLATREKWLRIQTLSRIRAVPARMGLAGDSFARAS